MAPPGAGTGLVVGPSSVASATGTQSSTLPVSPAAGGINTSTIRFVEAGDNWSFDPPQVRIPIEQSLTWENRSSAIIQIVSDDGTSFDSGPIAPGDSFTFTPTLVGQVPYRDKLHPWVRAIMVATNRR
jgi:hypothetical protein